MCGVALARFLHTTRYGVTYEKCKDPRLFGKSVRFVGVLVPFLVCVQEFIIELKIVNCIYNSRLNEI